jgi:hypothetical protein
VKKTGLLSLISVCAAGLIVLVSVQANAEIIFKKDGSIINGKVAVDGATSLTVVTSDGKSQTIPRNQIMRVLYTKIYLGKVYIRLTNGTTQEGYVVDEDQENYFVRKELNKIDEIKVQRSKVMFIARTNPTDLVGIAEKTRVKLKWSAPYIPGKNYRVYAKQVKEKDFILADEVSSESCNVTGLRSNSRYMLYVTSVDNAGVESLPSDVIEVMTLNNPPSKTGSIKKEVKAGSSQGRSLLNLEWEPAVDTDGEVVEYKVFTISNDDVLQDAGTTKNSQFVLKDIEVEKIKKIVLRAVDNMGDVSEKSYYLTKPVSVTLKPQFSYPIGKMGDLFGVGYGAASGIYLSNLLFDDTLIGFEAGFLRFSNKNENIDYMNMFTSTALGGYRYYFTGRFSTSAMLGFGFVYMSTPYQNAAYQKVIMSGWEPVITGSLSAEYILFEKVNASFSVGYSSIYEKNGLKGFVNATIGAGYRILNF